MLSFLFVEEGKLCTKKSSFEEFNLILFTDGAQGLFWNATKAEKFCWIFRYIFHSMDVLYIFSSALKKNYKMAPLWDGFCVEFCHGLSRFYLRERIHDPDRCYANCFKGLTFWILNKNFQETASLSIVLSLFIHNISSKHDRGTTRPGLHVSLLRRCRQILYNFHFQVQFLDTFWYAANEFYSKICFTVYSRLLILEF